MSARAQDPTVSTQLISDLRVVRAYLLTLMSREYPQTRERNHTLAITKDQA
jgi:hypothetical protein